MSAPASQDHPSRVLAQFAASLRFEDIPAPVIERAKALLLDVLASILAGAKTRPVQAMDRYAQLMGPAQGDAEVLVSGRTTSPVFAALVNAAAAHVVEQDDLHNSSVFHPAAVIFPPALAATQALQRSGRDLLTAAVAGYEAGIRIGEFLGRSHYRIFHTTGTVGTLAAALTTGSLLRLDDQAMLNALGSAGTQAAGLWEFLRDAADSKQLHTAKAAFDGMTAAWLAHDGFTGAQHILEGPQGLAAGMSSDADPTRLTDRLGERWALAETSFKFHASCRHTHPAADALLHVMSTHGLTHDQIAGVVTHVHQGAVDVLGMVDKPDTVHQSKFSMGTVLGLLAVHGRADLDTFDREALHDPRVDAFRQRVTMVRDDEVDGAYPRRWLGRVTVTTTDGRALQGKVDSPKGDPDNTLSRQEIEDKTRRLASYGGVATADTVERLIERIWALDQTERVGSLLS